MKSTILSIIVLLSLEATAQESARMSCSIKELANSTYSFHDMDDDALETTNSHVLNENIWGLEFKDYAIESQSIRVSVVPYSDVSLKPQNVLATSFRSPQSGRCVIQFVSMEDPPLPLNVFEVIARSGSETLWLGDQGAYGGEIFSYIEKVE